MCKKTARKQHFRNLGHTRCHYCCRKLYFGRTSNRDDKATAERIIPGSYGGTYAQVNVLMVCNECNQKRGNKDFVGFVTGSRFPRREWLLGKYEEAKGFYHESTCVRH